VRWEIERSSPICAAGSLEGHRGFSLTRAFFSFTGGRSLCGSWHKILSARPNPSHAGIKYQTFGSLKGKKTVNGIPSNGIQFFELDLR
jgi:hypothetical protein